MKKFLLLLFLIGTAYSAYSEKVLLFEPQNLDFEASNLEMPPVFWELPQTYEKVGYINVTSKHKPAQGDFSGRLRLPQMLDTTVSEGLIYQAISAFRFKGKTIRLKMSTKAAPLNDTSYANVFVEIKNDDQSFQFKLPDADSITTHDWQERTIEIKIPDNAIEIAYGLLLHGLGDAYIDDVKFDIIQPEDVVIRSKKIKLSNQDKTNILDFSKLYGDLHYYSPFFTGLEVNWHEVLLSGMEKVTKGIDSKEMPNLMLEHFKPLAPILKLNYTGNKENIYPKSLKKNDTIAFAMMHKGGFSPNKTEFFGSNYLNICSNERVREAAVMQVVKLPKNLKGNTLEVSVMAKQNAKDVSARTQLWIRVDRDKGYVQSKRKTDYMFGNTDWQELKVRVAIREDDVVAVRVGLVTMGEVEAYFDEVKVSIVETGENIPVKDYSAENAKFYPQPELGWYYPSSVLESGYTPEITNQVTYKGRHAFSIKSDEDKHVKYPQPGATHTYISSEGDSFTFPLVLYGYFNEDSVLVSVPETKTLASDIYTSIERPKGYLPTGDDVISRITILSDIYIYLLHFGETIRNYDDLDKLYLSYLDKVNSNINEDQFEVILDDFMNEFRQGKMFVFNGWENESFYTFPFRMIITDDNRVFVNQTRDSSIVIEGEEILEINEKKVSDIFIESDEAYFDYLNRKILAKYRIGNKGTDISFKVKNHEGKKREITVSRDYEAIQVQETRPPVMVYLNDSTAYIDITALSDKDLMDNKANFEKFKHIILDCRGKVLVNPLVFSIFTDKTLEGVTWIFPDYTSPYNQLGNNKKYTSILKGHNYLPNKKLYLLVNTTSSGFATPLVRLAQYYDLAKVYGRKAPASQFETIYYALPGKFSMSFTPGKGLMPDGSNICDDELIPDVLIPYDENTARNYLPILGKVLSDIEAGE